MKAVTAAEAAALAAFRIRDQGDRVGGIVFGDAHVAEIRPARTRASLDRFLAALAEAGETVGSSIGSGAVLVTGSVVTAGEARKLLTRGRRAPGTPREEDQE